jgi:hypothetical protein
VQTEVDSGRQPHRILDKRILTLSGLLNQYLSIPCDELGFARQSTKHRDVSTGVDAAAPARGALRPGNIGNAKPPFRKDSTT